MATAGANGSTGRVSGAAGRLPAFFDARPVPHVVVIVGHYGVGKTNLALNLALDAREAGRKVVLADLDVVNPYFRSSDYGGILADAGVELIAPAFAGTTLDSPGITGKVLTAIEWAREGELGEGSAAGGSVAAAADGLAPAAPAESAEATTAAGLAPAAPAVHGADRLLIIDAGGDDVGSTVLGRFSDAIAEGPYAMLYVVNRSRNLTHIPDEALAVLREIEHTSRLSASAIANNTHLADQTTPELLKAGFAFARKVADRAGVPLAFSTVESSLVDLASGLDVVYPVRILVRKPWE